MRPRIRFAAAVTVFALCLSTPASALAWPGKAHIVILREALRLAGNPEWVDDSVALGNATEPDHNGSHPDWHSFHPTGTFRGGPQAAADAYDRVIRALQAGDRRLASLELARMAHYFDDPTCPFHSQPAVYIPHDRAAHLAYDASVDGFLDRHSVNGRYMVAPRTPVVCTNVRQRAIKAAKYACSQYVPLRKAYTSGSISEGSSSAQITKSLLSHAANDLADVIRSIPATTAISPTTRAISPAPAAMRATISSHRPRRGSNVTLSVKCLTTAGRPLEAVRVVVYWPTPTGTTKRQAYSQPDGRAYAWLKPGAKVGSTLLRVPKGLTKSKRYRIRISATSGGQTAKCSTWIEPR